MIRGIQALRWEARLQARYHFYLVTFAVAFVWIALIRLLPAAARESPGLVTPALVLTNLQITAFYFAAALLLLEKAQGVLAAFFTSPLRLGEYVWVKAATLMALGVAENVLIVRFAFGNDLSWTWLIAGTSLLAAFYALAALAIAAPHGGINSFLVPSIGWVTFFSLPLVAYYGLLPWWTFLWHPVTPALVLLEAAYRPVSAGVIAYGVLGGLAWSVVTSHWARRRLRVVVGAGAA